MKRGKWRTTGSGVARPHGRRPAAVSYPFGHPTPLASGRPPADFAVPHCRSAISGSISGQELDGLLSVLNLMETIVRHDEAARVSLADDAQVGDTLHRIARLYVGKSGSTRFMWQGVSAQ
jgi:hypothetical protein